MTQTKKDAAHPGGGFDTIAAIATGQVLSAIGIVRISGPQARCWIGYLPPWAGSP